MSSKADESALSGPLPAPDKGQVRELLETRRKGEAATSELIRFLDPRTIYSVHPDPQPVFVIAKGELREIKPQVFPGLLE